MRFFNRITLQTPESLELEFTLAGIGNRAYALFIDYMVLSFILIGIFTIWVVFSIQLADFIENFTGGNNRLWLWLIAIQLLITFFIYVGYFVSLETLWQGRTVGKRIVKIRVIRDDGRPVGLQQSTLRALLRPVDDILFLGVFLIILGKQEKRLGDWVAGTLVIQDQRAVTSANFPLSDQAKALAERLPLEADLSRLLPEDFAVVREYLQRSKTMTSQAKADLSRQLAHQVREVINLEKIPKVTAHQFLEAVYLAYQQQSSTFEP